jgi:hypothetical protein
VELEDRSKRTTGIKEGREVYGERNTKHKAPMK